MATVNTHNLLSVLKSLFSELMQLNLEQRLNWQRTRKAAESIDISETLHRHIDQINIQHRSESATIAAGSSPTGTGRRTDTEVRTRESESLSEEDNRLREHLHDVRSRSYTESYMGERLVKSTWEHVYQAECKAREGDDVNARLHANIAAQAMKEAQKYMKVEEYEAFSSAVLEMLK